MANGDRRSLRAEAEDSERIGKGSLEKLTRIDSAKSDSGLGLGRGGCQDYVPVLTRRSILAVENRASCLSRLGDDEMMESWRWCVEGVARRRGK